eukprot:4732310-Pleurochrysis_carterae.AAC.2
MPNDLVGLGQLARMLQRRVRQSHDMVSVTDRRGSAVRRVRSGIEAGHGESGARWKREDLSVVAVRTAL